MVVKKVSEAVAKSGIREQIGELILHNEDFTMVLTMMIMMVTIIINIVELIYGTCRGKFLPLWILGGAIISIWTSFYMVCKICKHMLLHISDVQAYVAITFASIVATHVYSFASTPSAMVAFLPP